MEAPRCAPGRTWSVTRVTGRSGKTAGSRVVSRGCLPSEQRTKSPKIKHLTEWYTPLKESDQLCQLGRLDNPVRLSALWSDWHFRSTLWEKKKKFFFCSLRPDFESGSLHPSSEFLNRDELLPSSRFLNRDVCCLCPDFWIGMFAPFVDEFAASSTFAPGKWRNMRKSEKFLTRTPENKPFATPVLGKHFFFFYCYLL